RFSLGVAERPLGCKEVVVRPVRFVVVALAMVLAESQTLTSSAGTTPTNTRVTKDNIAGSYVSADVLGGTGTYSDATLTRCGTDRRQPNEPTIAIDPRNAMVRTSGSNDYCTIPTNHDAWA